MPVGAVADRRALWPLLYRTDPDVVLIGDVRAAEALRLCQQVRFRGVGTRVVVYTPGAGLHTVVPAAFAGAHAVVDTAAGVAELLDALRAPQPSRPPLTPALQRLAPLDRAILAMTLADTPAHEIGATVGLGREALAGRRAAILGALTGSAVAVRALDGARQLHA